VRTRNVHKLVVLIRYRARLTRLSDPEYVLACARACDARTLVLGGILRRLGLPRDVRGLVARTMRWEFYSSSSSK
jgi:hypothetical protein